MTGGQQQRRGPRPRWLNGERIARLRRERGLTQRKFAAICGLSPQTMSDIELGKWGTRPDRALRIATELGVTVADISLEPDQSAAA
jgi:transcriptional regulator with XRE-family HTH domain